MMVLFFSKTPDASGTATQPSTGASGGEDNGGFGYFDNLWNWLSSIVDFLAGIAENIAQVPQLVWNYVKDIPSQTWNFVSQIPSMIWGFFESSFNNICQFLSSIFDSIVSIPEQIFAFIKRIFIPDSDKIQESIDLLSNKFKDKFGLNSYDLSGILGTESEISNHSGTINICGYEISATFLDVSYLIKGVNTFRPYIRGFVVLLLILYNINQLLGFIGAGHLSLGSHIVTSLRSSKSDNGGKSE